MAERNYHVIGQQILELDVPSIAHAPAVQEAAAQRLRALDMTELEALFDRLAAPGTVMRLERVEIDLGDLCGADWQDQFESQFVECLTRSLEQTAERTRKQTAPESGSGAAFEQYVFFLRHGRLPWWGETPPQDWSQRILQALEPHQWQVLQLLLERDAHALRRLVHTAEDATLALLLDRHAGLPETQHLLVLWRPADQPPQMSHDEWRLQFWLAVFDATAVTAADGYAHGVAVMRRLLELRGAFAAPEPAEEVPGARASHSEPDLPQPWREWLAEARCAGVTPPGAASTAKAAISQDNVRHSQSPVQQTRGATSIANVATPQDNARHSRSPVQQAGTADSADSTLPGSSVQSSVQRATVTERDAGAIPQEGEAVYLGGAGCVILPPFLEELFRSNELLAGRSFRNTAAREQAVRLLAYLTFGDELVPEYDLLLPKLLCGMPWEEPLAPDKLTDAERIACDQLLHAVLAHWSALKSNSIDWLREQFFLRAAKLERLDLNWRLTVERRAQDVLLDRLPWGVGVVGLPWMQGPLYVHWIK
jgi:hypothetical protein